jgi:predicted amidohydrolase
VPEPLAEPFRLALAQINTTVGDLPGNRDLILDRMRAARDMGAELIAFPELALTGYPPEDLLLKPSFIRDNLAVLDEIASATGDLTVVLGCVDRTDDIFNAAAVLHDGRVIHKYHKQFLPTYGVFDEDRYFRPGWEAPVLRLGDVLLGVNVCEDIWYAVGPTNAQSVAGAEVIVNINASPFSEPRAPRTTTPSWLMSTWSAVRTSSCSTARVSFSIRAASCWPRGGPSRKTCWWSTWTSAVSFASDCTIRGGARVTCGAKLTAPGPATRRPDRK